MKKGNEMNQNNQEQSSNSEELLTTYEVAHHFDKHPDTIRNWVKKGYLKTYGIGRSIFFKRSEVESAIQLLNN
jgi:excisionase family DNA binding protein